MAPKSGPYRTLLAAGGTPKEWRNQRSELMRKIRAKRGRPMLVYAALIAPPPRVPAYMHPDDLVPFADLVGEIEGKAVDVLLETSGGLAEVAEEMVTLLRKRFDEVAFIIPHTALSAGTILAMSGDDLLMDYRSSLGPIDPQFPGIDGSHPVAAQAIIQGIETIQKKIAENKGQLDPVWIPILRNVDPGKYQAALNASELSIRLVSQWLVRYKFKTWATHTSTGKEVTPGDRVERAEGIARKLCDHGEWLSHGRSIKIEDLRKLKLQVTDYGDDPDLQELIWSLWVNLHHSMTSSNVYKVFEIEKGEVWRIAAAPIMQPIAVPSGGPPPAGGARPGTRSIAQSGKIVGGAKCLKCGTENRVQASFGKEVHSLEPGTVPFPKNSQLTCRGCGAIINLTGLKAQIEAQIGQALRL